MTDDAEVLWSYSVELYGRVREVCLALQDRYGLDVNILLFCCWTARCGQVLHRSDLAAIETAVSPWRAGVVARLRAARRWLKDGPEIGGRACLRARILESELAAERIGQALILAARPPFGRGAGSAADDAPACAAANLDAYVSVAGATPRDALVPVLAELVSAAFPQAGYAAIVARFKDLEVACGEGE